MICTVSKQDNLQVQFSS